MACSHCLARPASAGPWRQPWEPQITWGIVYVAGHGNTRLISQDFKGHLVTAPSTTASDGVAVVVIESPDVDLGDAGTRTCASCHML